MRASSDLDEQRRLPAGKIAAKREPGPGKLTHLSEATPDGGSSDGASLGKAGGMAAGGGGVDDWEMTSGLGSALGLGVPGMADVATEAVGRVQRKAVSMPSWASSGGIGGDAVDVSGTVSRSAASSEKSRPSAHDALAEASATPGQPLPDQLRSQLTTTAGADLSGVRVHDKPASAAAADAIGAHAYAVGQDIHFAAGAYQPGTQSGQKLIAHEVAHTVQQQNVSPTPQAKLEVSEPGDVHEREADAFAESVVTGGATTGPIAKITPGVVSRAVIQRDKNFDKITSGHLNEADAPDAIALPKELSEGMQSAWDGSLPEGKSQEQGGNLVRNKDGSYGWRKGKAGKSGMFKPDYGDVGKDQTLVGVGHTHPYDKSEGGHTNVSFSGGDISSIVYEKQTQPLNIVQSGETVFVLARTEEFEKLLVGLDAAGKRKLEQKIEKTWNDVYTTFKGKIPERAEAATRATCKAFHLVYYRGKGGSLTKVDVSK